MSADPYLDELRRVARNVAAQAGDRAAAFLPDGRTFLLEQTSQGVTMFEAEDSDAVALWIMAPKGNA